MVQHIVLFDFSHCPKYDFPIRHFFEQIRLRHRVFRFDSFHCGANCSPELLDKGYTHAMSMVFENIEDRDRYLTHHEHLDIVKRFLHPLTEQKPERVLVMDIESEVRGSV